MLSCAEAACRIDFQNGSALCCLSDRLPAGLDEQLFTNREGLEVLLPVVCPVLLPNAGAGNFQSAVEVLGVLLFHACQHGTKCCHGFCALRVNRQIDGDAGFAVGKLHQTILQIVPLAVLLFQKFLKVLCVLHHASTDSQILQFDAEQIDGCGCCIDIYLCPIHCVMLLLFLLSAAAASAHSPPESAVPRR